MDPTDGSYGWAPDDPRWTDTQAGGRGRLDPSESPPFADADTAVGAVPPIPRYPAPYESPSEAQNGTSAYGVPAYEPPSYGTPPPYETPAYGPPPYEAGDARTETLPAYPPSWSGHPGNGYPPAHLSGPAPVLRTGYGLGATPGIPAVRDTDQGWTGAVAPRELSRRGAFAPRLDRRLSGRSRRRDDEFRAAGRAELFSDEARYSVLFTLIGVWYAPVVILFLVWVLIVGAGDGPAGPRIVEGLLWLTTALALSLGVVGLLRWARVGWRALTLSIAAALIGGGVATIAHTLSG